MQFSSLSRLIFIFPLISVLIWSVNVVITRVAIDVISPLSISFYRWLFAFLILTPFILPKAWHQRQVIKNHLGKLAVLGLFGMVIYQGLAYIAAHSTTATNMGIINALIPLLTIAVATVILKEKPTRFAIIGGLLSLLGLAILIGQGNPASLLTGDIHLGDGLMLLAVTGYACYGVLVRLWQLPLTTWVSVYVQIFFGALFQLPLVMYEGFASITQENGWIIFYSCLFPSIIAPFFWVKAVGLMGPNRTSIFMNLLPVFTAIIAIAYLGEAWKSYHTVGGLLTLAGVILAQLKPKISQHCEVGQS
ncbi:DMT family transporter [Alkanindiges sp. WGS2144]|uniref:DMT family transporter n=1 Tax=Alkanindiges sp. WGS2144 TaxID=3366808 RepID=UPI0037518DC1